MESLASSMQSSNLNSGVEPVPVLVPGSSPSSARQPMPQSLPTTVAHSYLVRDVPTDAWAQLFADRIILGLSQRDAHVGTFLSCQVDASILDYSPDKARYTVSSFLGGQRPEDQVLHVLCRRVTEEIIALRSPGDATACSTVLLAISLSPGSSDKREVLDSVTFRLLVKLFVDLYKVAIRVKQEASS